MAVKPTAAVCVRVVSDRTGGGGSGGGGCSIVCASKLRRWQSVAGMWGNSFDRRRWIRETWKTYKNVGRTMHVIFIVGMLQSDLTPLPAELDKQLRQEADTHGDMLLLEKVPERKSPCLKTMAWYRYAVHAFPRATFWNPLESIPLYYTCITD